MKIYTRRGDDGSTAIRGRRVAKDDPLIEALGAIDELTCVIGLVRSQSQLPAVLLEVQNDLQQISGALAGAAPASDLVVKLENMIDRYGQDLEELDSFLVPGRSLESAGLHQARAVCRRAERRIFHAARSTDLAPYVTAYINRLSDLLFVLARWVDESQD